MPTEEQTYRKSIDDKLDLILLQTTAHNGRLRWVEKMVWVALGGVGVLTVMFIPSLGYLFVQSIDNTTHIAAIAATIKK